MPRGYNGNGRGWDMRRRDCCCLRGWLRESRVAAAEAAEAAVARTASPRFTAGMRIIQGRPRRRRRLPCNRAIGQNGETAPQRRSRSFCAMSTEDLSNRPPTKNETRADQVEEGQLPGSWPGWRRKSGGSHAAGRQVRRTPNMPNRQALKGGEKMFQTVGPGVADSWGTREPSFFICGGRTRLAP